MSPRVHSLWEEAFSQTALKSLLAFSYIQTNIFITVFPINIPFSEDFVNKPVNFGDIYSFANTGERHRKFEKFNSRNTIEKSNGEVFICFCSLKRVDTA